jgi:holo-[acyl-carrier-protein] synthase
MIVGIGIDIVELSRIHRSLERFGMGFVNRLMHVSERGELPEDLLSQNAVAHVGGRFAAKEAAVKALGTGFAEGIGLHDVRIATLPGGRPALSLHGAAEARASLLGVVHCHVSLSHEKSFAAATAILEGPSS